ncbi:hypothetical protein EG240_11960 [Paenimyroides tangerinum]|uniref:Thioredoxin domain-containing protein n=1 Tax=Paenimyroides tangerinum TaxID=2488728 RepID=A0A3P3W5S9_9FLAO|nr:redoxin family protein [Paenimyroides tangerinum]RRJ89346.1 hypothetical protein EG240_11960 [Paenimyroides tangerinum]
MTQYISNFTKAFRAESIKMKSTRIVLTAIVLSVLIPLMAFVFSLINGEYNSDLTEKTNFFQVSFNSYISVFEFIAILVAIISASRISQIEFKNNTWQLIETQPLSKFSIYFAKYSKLLIINAITISVFFATTYVVSFILYLLQENKEFATINIGFEEIQTAIRFWVSLLFLTTLIYVISVRFSNFILSIIVGIGLIISTSILQALNILPKWYPLKITSNAISNPSDLGYFFTYSEGFSVVISLLLLFIGYKWYANKTFKNAFVKNGKTISTSLATILILSGICFWILKPNQMMQSNETLISGTITSPDNIKEGYLVDALTNATLYTFPVSENQFKLQITEDLKLGKYHLKFDNAITTPIIIGKNDIVNIEVEHKGNDVNFKKTGTRLAENNLADLAELSTTIAYFISNDIYADNPTKISEELIDEYESQLKKLGNAYTNDNYIIRDDYRAIQQKQLIAYFINLWNQYEKKQLVKDENFKKQDYEFYKLLNDKLNRKDTEMLFDNNYRQIVVQELIANDTSDLDENTKSLNAILKLPNDSFKEKLLTTGIVSAIDQSKSASEIVDVFDTYKVGLTDAKNINYLNAKVQDAIRLGKNAKAPNFEAFDLNGNIVRLQDFKGKFVVIDVWATWCGPCKYVSPSFEKAANQYAKNENIVFIAISVDKNKIAWISQAKNKPKTVKQLIATNIDTFGKEYSIESIPRFILIDKEGNFVNSKMPMANESAFDIVLENTLKSE